MKLRCQLLLSNSLKEFSSLEFKNDQEASLPTCPYCSEEELESIMQGIKHRKNTLQQLSKRRLSQRCILKDFQEY